MSTGLSWLGLETFNRKLMEIWGLKKNAMRLHNRKFPDSVFFVSNIKR